MTRKKLPLAFYRADDVIALGRELLGKLLCTRIDGQLCKAIISETEAYVGETDRASHAFGGRRTARTKTMYAPGGCAYVYLCYGIHHLFNVVTNVSGVPHAVLVRAAMPQLGRAVMERRRGRSATDQALLTGPGNLTRGLGITTELNGASLSGTKVWIEDRGIEIPKSEIVTGPRVGVDYAREDAALPYRFRLADEACAQLLRQIHRRP